TRREKLAELVMKFRRLGLVDRELDDWNVRLGKDMAQHRPGAVVESPGRVAADGERREELRDALGERRISRRRILDLEERAWESAEIVYCSRALHRGRGDLRDVPMRGDREDDARPRELRTDPAPPAGPRVLFERVHRIAVTEEDGRHGRHLGRDRLAGNGEVSNGGWSSGGANTLDSRFR